MPAATQKSPPIQVMVVDDSAVIRGLLTRVLKEDPSIDVVASLGNGELAVKGLARHDVDVVLLDIDMPVMDGLTALPKLLEVDPEIKVIMVSSLTLRNADISLRALELGAADYIPKPSSSMELSGGVDFRDELIRKVRSLARARRAKTSPGRVEGAPRPAGPAAGRPIKLRQPGKVRPHVLAIGSSTGGPPALHTFLGGIKDGGKLPILISQHMPTKFTTILAELIGKYTGLPSAEAKDGEVIAPGHIYVAPGDYHMVVDVEGPLRVLRLNQEPPENFCRPAVDPMLRSVAKAYGSRVLTVILTGMGVDGLKGGEEIIRAGGTVIAQDEESSVVWGMPGAVAEAGLCSAVLPLRDLAPYVLSYATGNVR